MNNLQNVSLQQIQDLEVSLSQLRCENQSLKQQLILKESELGKAQTTLQNLHSLIQKDPLLNILHDSFENQLRVQTQKQAPQQWHKSRRIYESKIQELSRANSLTEGRINHLMSDLGKIQREKCQLESRKMELEVALFDQKQQNQILEGERKHQEALISQNLNVESKLKQRILQLTKDNEQLLSKADFEFSSYSDKIYQVCHSLTHFLKESSQMNQTSGENAEKSSHSEQQASEALHQKDLNKSWKTQKQIMEALAKQLEDRQSEVNALLDHKSSQQTLERQGKGMLEASGSHSQKFKTEQMHLLLNHKQKQVSELSEEFFKLKEMLSDSMESQRVLQKSNSALQKQIEEQRQKVEHLKKIERKLESVQAAYGELKRDVEETEEQLAQIVLQNQCYHHFMFEMYGQERFLDIIQKEKNAYLKRRFDRSKVVHVSDHSSSLTERWINVEELLKVNRDLRIKIRRGEFGENLSSLGKKPRPDRF